MKIRKLQLKNIGVFDDETIEFQPCPVKDKAEIHVFTGQNGSGKTTILQGLASVFNSYLSADPFHRNPTGLIWGNDINSFSKKFHHIFDKQNLVNSFLSANADIQSEDPLNLKTVVFADPQTGNLTVYDEIGNIGEYRSLINNYNRGKLNYAVFAFSAYRQIQSKRVEALYEPKNFNPLNQSLNFIKDYSQENQITINQLIANNISKSAIEKGRNKEKSERFAKVLSSVEQIIAEITGWKIEFDMQTEPVNLVTKVNGEELEFDVLPDGLRSLISWIADLLGRVDLLKWNDDLPIFEKNLILFLDEIEVHLHPAWQRKILPVVQKLFKNSQIFVSTHSPFVVNSIDNAWVYKLEFEKGKAKVAEVVRSEDGISYQTVLSEIFGVDEEFGGKTQEDLDRFYGVIRNGKKINEKELLNLAKSLAVQSEELNSIIQIELRQLSRRKGKEFSI